MPVIELPNGEHAEFPDNMSHEEIKSVLQKKFPPAKQKLSAQISEPESGVKSFQRHLEGLLKMEKNVPSLAKAVPIFANVMQNITPPAVSALQNVGAGALYGLQNTLKNAPDTRHLLPKKMQGKEVNPFQIMGVQKAQNPLSAAGIEQDIGQWIPAALMPELNIGRVGTALNAAGRFGKTGANILSKGIPAGVYGSQQTENPLVGATLGVGGQALAEVTPLIKPAFNKLFRPEEAAEKIVNKLGQGSKNVTQNAKSLASDIRNAYNMREQESSIYLNYAKDRAGSESIYKNHDPLRSTKIDQHKELLNKVEDLGIGDLYQAFKKEPSFQNAHNLQSELGVMIGDLEKNPVKTIAERAEINKIKSIRDDLKDDILSFLNKRDLTSNENLSPAYQRGIDLYRKNVVPFLSNKKLRDIVRGGKTVVKNIHSIFDTPSDIFNKKTGKVEIGAINKIAQDLSPEARHKILYSAIGGHPSDANTLLKRMAKVENKGFGEYLTPELKEDINALNKKVYNTKVAKTVGKGTAAVAGLAGAVTGTNKLISAIF